MVVGVAHGERGVFTTAISEFKDIPKINVKCKKFSSFYFEHMNIIESKSYLICLHNSGVYEDICPSSKESYKNLLRAHVY